MTNENKTAEPVSGVVEEMDQSLVRTPESGNLVLGTQDAHEALRMRAQGLQALRKVSIKALNTDDFHKFGKNPWLEASGVNKVTEIYGIDFTKPVYTKEWKDKFDEEKQEIIKNSHYIYQCELTAIFSMDGHRQYTATGTSSTWDDFYKRKNAEGISVRQHPLNVDESDVKKKAETNARARCLIGLGIANFTPEELSGAGMDTSKSTGHQHKSDSPKSGPSEKQMKFIRGLFEQKVLGMNPSEWFDWFEKQGVTGKQGSNLIEWFMDKADGSIDYEEGFKAEYKDIIGGKYAKPKEAK